MIDRDYFAVNKNGKGKGVCDRKMLAWFMDWSGNYNFCAFIY